MVLLVLRRGTWHNPVEEWQTELSVRQQAVLEVSLRSAFNTAMMLRYFNRRCFTDVYCTKALQARCLCHPVPVAPVDGIC